ncbi:MAG TPA: aminoglycoside phosphotransferase family protein [Promineifilum sp.]|nr:aminoglycoside phosphotransferase family protein [Promineifilum sp.]
MLEKPDLPDERILACLREQYGLSVGRVEFLPIGADSDTAVYRAETVDATPWFVKLRREFDPSAALLPKTLSDRGIVAVIAPLMTRNGALWADIAPFTLILYPFIEGRNGYEVEMTASCWRKLGAALRRIHAAEIPPALAASIRRETYSPRWRDAVRRFLGDIERQTYDDPVAAALAAYLKLKRPVIRDLVEQTERHAETLMARPPAFVLCHSDIHAGNVLIGKDDNLYIVDWDQPIFASRERDLMYPGGAQGFTGHSPEEEEVLFYEGYGPTEVDMIALAYYRAERIVEDIAVYCEELLLSDAGGADREQSLAYVKSNFMAGGTIERAKDAPWK